MILGQFKEASRNHPANPFFDRLAPHLGEPGRAIDLGAGWGKGSAWLAQRGWQVDAVEIDPDMLADLHEIPGVKAIQGDMADFPKQDYNLIAAVFSLFFLPERQLLETWQQIREHLAPGAIFAGQLLGVDDDWSKSGIAAGLERSQIEQMVGGLKVREWDEVNRMGKTIWGEPKHWHIHHLILQRD